MAVNRRGGGKSQQNIEEIHDPIEDFGSFLYTIFLRIFKNYIIVV